MKNQTAGLILLAAAIAIPSQAQTAKPAPKPKYHEIEVGGVFGFQDTPMQPDGRWHVHDPARPQPPIVSPGSSFSQQAAAPSDAIVLFDGKDLSQWTDHRGNPAPWLVQNGEAVTTKTDIITKREFGDIQLHLEFREPTPATGDGQGRGNSGVFFMGRYEIQVLDCYNNKTYADGATGAIYAQHPPLANACRPPGQWQTYDIVFTAPRFAGKQLLQPAYFTVIWNGVLVQNHTAALGPMRYRALANYDDQTTRGPVMLQYHNSAVRFRNIWIRPLP